MKYGITLAAYQAMLVNLRIALISILMALMFAELKVQAQKKILLESIVGTWCGLCPGGIAFTEDILSSYPDIIPVSIHAGDPMECTSCPQVTDVYTGGGVPAFLVDRKLFSDYSFVTIGLDYELLSEKVAERLSEPSSVDVQFSKFWFEESAKEVTVELSCEFLNDMNASDLRFNLYVVEKSVRKNEQGYHQTNFYNIVEGHPYENAGAVITDFEHQNVLRKMAGGAWGTPGSIAGGGVKSSDRFTHKYRFRLSDDWTAENLSFIGVVQKFTEGSYNQREILNAQQADFMDLQQGTSTSTKFVDAVGDFSVFPNPICENSSIQFELKEPGQVKLDFIDIQGKRVRLLDAKLESGSHSILMSNFPSISMNGFLELRTEDGMSHLQTVFLEH